jgi:hypothetical protein
MSLTFISLPKESCITLNLTEVEFAEMPEIFGIDYVAHC